MKVGILGTGDVGRALGRAFLASGHDVMIGSRDKTNPKLTDWLASAGAKAQGGTFADAARFGDWIAIATMGAANKQVAAAAGAPNTAGKIVIDTTNPLDFSQGMPPRMLDLPEGSSGAQWQALFPDAKVVKAFNTISNVHMYHPKIPGGPPTMYIAGNDAEAKDKVTELLATFGFPETFDAGGIEASHYLEAMTMVWVAAYAHFGSPDHAFRLIHK